MRLIAVVHSSASGTLTEAGIPDHRNLEGLRSILRLPV
jgi:hypothetical protein